MTSDIRQRVRDVVRDNARLSVDIDQLDDDSDLFVAGMTSHQTISVMLALEDTFDVVIPDDLLRANVFRSVAAITAAIVQLLTTEAT
jgi:acyl carrier protein